MGKLDKVNIKMVFGLLALAILTRLLPHPPNFAPITSIALFSGFHFKDKRFAIFFPLSCMFVTDIYLGFHSLIPLIYSCFAINTYIGFKFKKLTLPSVLLASFSFFLISNLGVWFVSYPLNFSGLTTCFVLAIPFFINSLSGDLFYSLVLDLSIKKIKQPVFNLIRSNQIFSQ